MFQAAHLSNLLKSCLFAVVSFGFVSAANAEKINTSTAIINKFITNTKNVEFLSGIEIASPSKEFGGFSGLSIQQNGSKLIAVSDVAKWLTLDLVRDKNGKLSSVKNASLDCLCRNNGTPYGNKRWGDSEGLVIKGDNAFVSFEGLNRVNVYDLDAQNKPSNAKQQTASFKPFKLNQGKGLEALALAPKTSALFGNFIAIAEDSLNSVGNHRAFIANAVDITEFAIKKTNDYMVTDASFLQNGDLLILERRFETIFDIGMRIRRFSKDTLTSSQTLKGKTINGEILLESGLSNPIDNMEGLATWQNTKGETILSIISDDNFLGLQRTLLLEFKLLN
ncbi:MAG: esterase-like activity of phytase family protein [Nitratireductor sp.]